jgi:dTDP-4-dehydrorhamnose reductase
MRVIIGNGKVCNVIKHNDDIVLPHSLIEVTSISSIENQLSKFDSGTVVINTASKINLEWCEIHRDEAEAVNVAGAINVAKVCQNLGLHLVHISSGCIFDGGESEKEYTETDTPTPAAWYTETKTQADHRILDLNYEKITIVRPRQLISSIKNPTNMLTKFLSLKEGNFIDSRNSLTCIEDMGLMIDHLIQGKHYGIYNLANEGTISPYEIALELKDKLHPDFQVNKILYNDYLKLLKVKRVNTVLNIDKLKSTGFNPRTAKDALDWCIQNYKD